MASIGLLLHAPSLAQKKPAKPPATVALDKLAVSKDHPRILITPADLPALREKIKQEQFAGHWQQIVAHSVGGTARVDPKNAFSNLGALQSRCFMLTELLECSAMHALLSEEPAVADALNLFITDFDPQPFEAALPENEFMPHGEFLEGFPTCYDWAYNVLSDASRTKLRGIIEKHSGINYSGFINKKSWEATCDANNHSMASMGGVGLAALALWHEHKDALKWANLSRDKMVAYLAQSFDADGSNFEGNLYGPFGVSRILPFAAAITRYGHEDPFANARLENMVDSWIAELVPGGKGMLPLNDADGSFYRWPGVHFLYCATKYGHSRARWMWEEPQNKFAGSGGHTWPYALLYDSSEIKPTPPTTLVKCSKGRGLLTVRTGYGENDFLACFEAGERRNGTHCQADHGSFLIYARGQCLAADTGYSNENKEGSPNQTIGHNGVLIDGKGMAISGGGQFVEAEMKLFEKYKSFAVGQADLLKAYNKGNYNVLKQATRVFLCMTREFEPKGDQTETPESSYIVIVDCFVKDGGKHDFTFLLHGNKDSTIEPEKDRAAHKVGPAALDIVPCGFDDDNAKFEVARFPSGNFGEHPLLKITSNGQRYAALTVLAPRAEADAPVKVTKTRKGGKLLVSVERGTRVDEFTLTFPPDKPPTIAVTRKLDGKVAEKADIRLK